MFTQISIIELLELPKVFTPKEESHIVIFTNLCASLSSITLAMFTQTSIKDN